MVWLDAKGALIFQEKAIFRKDSRKNDCWTDGFGPTYSCNLLLVESSMEREITLHQRERCMASLLLEKA